MGGDPSKAKATHVVLISIDGLAASYLDDPRAEMPTLRMLAKKGAAAKGMVTSFPSVTWPSHVSLVTGTTPSKHGVLGNYVWSREKQRGLVYIGDPELTKDQAIHVPTLYDVAKQAGMKTAAFCWPCCTEAKSLDWMIPDAAKAEFHARFTTPGLVKELATGDIDISNLGKWGWDKEFTPKRDELYARACSYMLAKHQTNLILVHLTNPDGVEHAKGPHTPEAYSAVAESDRLVKDVWETMLKQPFADKAALFVVSDHGFAPVQKLIHPNIALMKMGLVKTDEDKKVTERRVWCVSQGGCSFVYVLDKEHKQELLKEIKESLGKVEGVKSIIEPDQFQKLGLPDPAKNGEMGDLVLATGPGYSFNDSVTAKEVVAVSGNLKGTHGHLPDQDFMHATFIAAGAGIEPGVQLKTIRNIDVAPTIARLLGLALPDAEGRVLTEIIKQ